MGYSTCAGFALDPHKEKRSCDACDKCPTCDDFRPTSLYCWRCCGPIRVCPDCAFEVAAHVVSVGPPPAEWEHTAGPGFRRALRIAVPA